MLLINKSRVFAEALALPTLAILALALALMGSGVQGRSLEPTMANSDDDLAFEEAALLAEIDDEVGEQQKNLPTLAQLVIDLICEEKSNLSPPPFFDWAHICPSSYIPTIPRRKYNKEYGIFLLQTSAVLL